MYFLCLRKRLTRRRMIAYPLRGRHLLHDLRLLKEERSPPTDRPRLKDEPRQTHQTALVLKTSPIKPAGPPSFQRRAPSNPFDRCRISNEPRQIHLTDVLSKTKLNKSRGLTSWALRGPLNILKSRSPNFFSFSSK